MKIFQRYNPLQVAKYVKILFRGRLYIKDVGAFEFDKGKILIPKVKDKLHLSVITVRLCVCKQRWLNQSAMQ